MTNDTSIKSYILVSDEPRGLDSRVWRKPSLGNGGGGQNSVYKPD